MGEAPEPEAKPEANGPKAPPAQQPADRSTDHPADLPPDLPPDLPRGLRLLSRLVTLLVVTMIGGFLIIVALFVIRLGGAPDKEPGLAPDLASDLAPDLLHETALPATITLPEGTRPEAVTLARNWVLVLTEGGRVLLYERATGTLRQEILLQE